MTPEDVAPERIAQLKAGTDKSALELVSARDDSVISVGSCRAVVHDTIPPAVNSPFQMFMRLAAHSAFDLHGCSRHAIAILQDVVFSHRLTIHADEQVAGFVPVYLLREEGFDGGALGGFDIISEAATTIVEEQDFHGEIPLVE